MKNEKIEIISLRDIAKSWGIDYQVVQIKKKLVQIMKENCKKEKISQRKLAGMVGGLTQDRVSKIFSGQVGHMSIDKLVEIMSALKLKIELRTKKPVRLNVSSKQHGLERMKMRL